MRFAPSGAEPGAPTRIRRLHQAGSLKLRFPRTRSARAEAVLVNTAGGLAGGDRFGQRFTCAAGGRLLVTTQAAERVYRSVDGTPAEIETQLCVEAGAEVCYLPQETILFDGGALRRRLEADVAVGARLLLCESVVLGRSESGERVRAGALADRWRVRREGRLVFAEDLRLGPDWRAVASPGALGPFRAFATLLACGSSIEAAALRPLLGASGGASLVDGCLVVRLLAEDGYALRQRLVPVLAALSPGGLPGLWSL